MVARAIRRVGISTKCQTAGAAAAVVDVSDCGAEERLRSGFCSWRYPGGAFGYGFALDGCGAWDGWHFEDHGHGWAALSVQSCGLPTEDGRLCVLVGLGQFGYGVETAVACSLSSCAVGAVRVKECRGHVWLCVLHGHLWRGVCC